MSEENQSQRLIDQLFGVEYKWLLDYKLPSPNDKTGIGRMKVEFIDKFGRTRYDSLFSGRGEKSLYQVSAVIKGIERKRKPKKALPYPDDEKAWFKAYPMPEHFGENEQLKLLENYTRAFPDRPKRTKEALAWQLMHRKGKWNSKRKEKRGARKEKETKMKTRRKLKRHNYTKESEDWIIKQRHPKSTDNKTIERLTAEFNSQFSDKFNPSITPRAYYEK